MTITLEPKDELFRFVLYLNQAYGQKEFLDWLVREKLEELYLGWKKEQS